MKHLHTITHIDIPAPDLDKAIEFYSKVFDWGIEVVTVEHYAFFRIRLSSIVFRMLSPYVVFSLAKYMQLTE